MNNYSKKILILFVSTAIYISCSDSSNPGQALPFGDDFSYPLKVGNTWNYDREWSNFNFRPDSINVDSTFDNTVHYSKVEVFVDREETILDSMNTTVVITKDIDGSMIFNSSHYYYNTDEGLFILAYNSGGGSISYPKISSNFYDELLNGNFTILQRISSLHDWFFSANNIFSDTLRFEDPPVQSFKYPLKQDLEWTYRNDYFIINKKVVGKETVEVPSGQYDCWKIQWIYDFSNTGLFVGSITFYDYVSSKGLIKRTLFMKDVPLTTPGNPNDGGLADYKEDIILTGINF